MSEELVDDGANLTEEDESGDSLGAPTLAAAIEALLLLADEPLTTLALRQAASASRGARERARARGSGWGGGRKRAV